jgi:hypothetical protein
MGEKHALIFWGEEIKLHLAVEVFTVKPMKIKL